jgi:3-oxoacyl-[acyl-carrier protein] reductase
MTIEGKTALVTGGAGPAGAAIARALASAGARVCVADPNLDAARALGAELDGMGEFLDPLDDTAYARLAYAMGDAWGDLDILVIATPPVHLARPMEQTADADFDRVLSLHARPIFLATRHFIPAMLAGGRGVVLNCCSITGIYNKSHPGWLGPAKAWVMAATESMAAEYAPHGLRVNAMFPIIDDSPPVPSFMGGAKSATRQQALASVPLGRFAGHTDIGDAAVFLCSDTASFLTGVILPVDGGRRL